jgi:hypothetical protein
LFSAGDCVGLEPGGFEALRFFDRVSEGGGGSLGSAARLAAERVTLDDMSVGHGDKRWKERWHEKLQKYVLVLKASGTRQSPDKGRPGGDN